MVQEIKRNIWDLVNKRFNIGQRIKKIDDDSCVLGIEIRKKERGVDGFCVCVFMFEYLVELFVVDILVGKYVLRIMLIIEIILLYY